jgi:hypothetical protein
MAITLAQAIKDLALHAGRLLEGTVASSPAPTVKSVTDPALEDKGRLLDLADSYLRMADGGAIGQVRRIAKLQLDKGAVPVVRDFTASPAAAETFEIYMGVHPDDLKEIVNKALERLYYVEEQTVSADGTQDLVVKGAGAVVTGVSEAGDIIEVFWDRGNTDAKYRNYMSWWLFTTSTLIKMRIFPVVNTGDIIVRLRQYYSALVTDATTTECPPKLLLAASAVYFWEWLLHPMRRGLKSADEIVTIEREREKALAEFRAQAAKDLPPIIRRRQLPAPFIMPV